MLVGKANSNEYGREGGRVVRRRDTRAGVEVRVSVSVRGMRNGDENIANRAGYENRTEIK